MAPNRVSMIGGMGLIVMQMPLLGIDLNAHQAGFNPIQRPFHARLAMSKFYMHLHPETIYYPTK